MSNKKKTELPVNQIICDHNVRAMRKFSDNSIDSIVTDPQYGLNFMGKGWDKVLPSSKTWIECLRIAKPGAFMLCFGGTRTYHRVTCAIEDAGWQIRDCLMWLYGSGFPKSLDVSKAIDKRKGKMSTQSRGFNVAGGKENFVARDKSFRSDYGYKFNPNSKLAQLWDGYGTALKPAWEPIIVAMKPVDVNFAENAEKYKVAGLNIDGGRIGTSEEIGRNNRNIKGSILESKNGWNSNSMVGLDTRGKDQGRWPANLILDEEAAKMLDKQSGELKSRKANRGRGFSSAGSNEGYKRKSHDNPNYQNVMGGFNDSGGASRFFYIAKASRSERNAGLSKSELQQIDGGRKPENPGGNNPRNRGARKDTNFHPTVKPLSLMEYLCLLLKMPNKKQIILDPFVGSGTTCVACKELGINYIGIDNSEDYCELARKRLKNVKPNLFTKKPKELKKKTKDLFNLK